MRYVTSYNTRHPSQVRRTLLGSCQCIFLCDWGHRPIFTTTERLDMLAAKVLCVRLPERRTYCSVLGYLALASIGPAITECSGLRRQELRGSVPKGPTTTAASFEGCSGMTCYRRLNIYLHRSIASHGGLGRSEKRRPVTPITAPYQK